MTFVQSYRRSSRDHDINLETNLSDLAYDTSDSEWVTAVLKDSLLEAFLIINYVISFPQFWIWMFVQWRNSQTQRKLENKAKVCTWYVILCTHTFLLSGVFPASRPTSSPTASSWSWHVPWTAASQALCPTWTAWTTLMEPRSSATSPRLGCSLGKRRSRVRTMCVSILQEMAGETVYYMIQ